MFENMSGTVQAVETLVTLLNKDFFPGEEIKLPIITIQSTPRAYGHVSVAKIWKNKNGGEQHELNLGADTLNRWIGDICATLLHEMVHLYNMEHEVQDTSRGGAYHNKKFKEEAERRGLIISHDERIGWSITEPGPRVYEFLERHYITGLTSLCRTTGKSWTPGPMPGGRAINPGPTGTGTKKQTSTRKLQCPCCKNSVRATKKVNILCGDCMEQMVEV